MVTVEQGNVQFVATPRRTAPGLITTDFLGWSPQVNVTVEAVVPWLIISSLRSLRGVTKPNERENEVEPLIWRLLSEN